MPGMMDSPKTHRLRAWFSGRVQGIGFRYSTLQVSKGYEVTGYVKNLLDGRVELEAEGQKSEVEAFLAALQDEMGDFIRETEVNWNQVSKPRYQQFIIQ